MSPPVQTIKYRDLRTGTEHTCPGMVEIAPGVFTGDVPREAVPRFGLVKLLQAQDGTYFPQLVTWHGWLRVGSDPKKTLGLDVDYKTLFRLAKAGFIKSLQLSPGHLQIDPQSLYEHISAARETGFWSAERTRRYRETRAEEGGPPTPGRGHNNRRAKT